MRAFLIHRSVGQQLLDSSTALRAAIDDLNVNSGQMTLDSTMKKIALDTRDTEPSDLLQLSLSLHAEGYLAKHEFLALKSCYSSLGISDEAASSRKIAAWRDACASVQRMGLTPIILSPPPRRPQTTTRKRHDIDLDFLIQLKDLASSEKAIAYFDLHGTLASDDGFLRKEYRRVFPLDSHPNAQGAKDAALAFENFLARLLKSD